MNIDKLQADEPRPNRQAPAYVALEYFPLAASITTLVFTGIYFWPHLGIDYLLPFAMLLFAASGLWQVGLRWAMHRMPLKIAVVWGVLCVTLGGYAVSHFLFGPDPLPLALDAIFITAMLAAVLALVRLDPPRQRAEE